MMIFFDDKFKLSFKLFLERIKKKVPKNIFWALTSGIVRLNQRPP